MELVVILMIIVLLIFIGLYIIQRNWDKLPRAEPINLKELPIFIITCDNKRYKYVTAQLDKMGMTNYRRWDAVIGAKTSRSEFKHKYGVLRTKLKKGEAGCAASHLSLWRYLADLNYGKVLILEDDCHFHPNFVELFEECWRDVPADNEIVYLGHLHFLQNGISNSRKRVVSGRFLCAHAYIFSGESARSILNYRQYVSRPIDEHLYDFFPKHGTSYAINDNCYMTCIKDKPKSYKLRHGKKCFYNGIVYQNVADFPSFNRTHHW